MMQVPLKTYVNPRKTATNVAPKPVNIPPKSVNTPPKSVTAHPIRLLLKREPLTTKKAIEFLLAGTVKTKVCRYCLNIDGSLNELDQYMNIAGSEALYRVTIRDMVAAVHPFKVVTDQNFPNKICNKCLDQAIKSYLFAQQCEQSERALRDCYNDMFEKLEKLDPVQATKKRGRRKLHPNNNILYTEHPFVIDYAAPLRNLINSGAIPYTKEPEFTQFECKKCWQVLPNVESLVNHENIHPPSMWYHCRLCGKSFAKNYNFKKHVKKEHSKPKKTDDHEKKGFECRQCGTVNENHILHLQHIEKHKFQIVLKHLIEKKMDKLCAICLDKGQLVDMDKIICLHGGYPALTGDRTLYNILSATVPEMNIIHNYTGSKICNKCLDHAIVAYIFTHRINYIRNRLDTCITKMLENLSETATPHGKLFIEISTNGILPVFEEDIYEDLLLDDTEDVQEEKLKVDVLEDEYRLKSDSESDTEEITPKTVVSLDTDIVPSKVEQRLMNGYQSSDPNKVEDVCSEFLTFKKKKKE